MNGVSSSLCHGRLEKVPKHSAPGAVVVAQLVEWLLLNRTYVDCQLYWKDEIKRKKGRKWPHQFHGNKTFLISVSKIFTKRKWFINKSYLVHFKQFLLAANEQAVSIFFREIKIWNLTMVMHLTMTMMIAVKEFPSWFIFYIF